MQKRVAHGERAVAERVGDFGEMALPLNEDGQRAQASRCMYCGVAFCQYGAPFGSARASGCPLHNLIPEWNDLLFHGRWDDAAERLSLTNPFPEFTGRVCPALCEAACNLGEHDEPTTIRDDERAISDHAWAAGKVKPLAAPAADAPRVAVVGSGPSGLACAWELARRGVAVTLVEKDDRAGGLLMYGIPNMKLPKEVVERRVELMRESGITVTCGVDASDPKTAEELLRDHDAVVLAVGARQSRGVNAPGNDLSGVLNAVDYLTQATKALLADSKPEVSADGLDVVVIGGGDTGTDCVATAVRQGAKSVRQLEFLPEPPRERAAGNGWPEWPSVRKDDYGQIEASELMGADPRTWATDTLELFGEDGHVSGLKVVSLDWSKGRPERIQGSERELEAQLVLIATGFTGPERSVFDAFGVALREERGGLRPELQEATHRTQAQGEKPVFVSGDAKSGSSLVVSAIVDGLACASEVAAKFGL